MALAGLSGGPCFRPRQAPGPSGHRLLGSLHDVRTDRIRFVTNATREFGDIVAFRMGPKRLFLLRHPHHVRHVLCENHRNYRKGLGLAEARPMLGDGLLTSDGDLWASQRRLLQAAFQKDRMEWYGQAICEAVCETAERWRALAMCGDAVDIGAEMTRLTMNVLSKTLLLPRLMNFASECADDLAEVGRWAMRRMTSLLPLPLVFPTPSNLGARRALTRLEQRAQELIADSRAGGTEAGKFIALLEDQARCDSGNARPGSLVRDEVLTLLLAGHETTAAVLSWTWYLLGGNTEAYKRLRTELDEQLGGADAKDGDLPRLPYTRMVLSEAMRLYPPVWLLPRKSIAADEIGGYEIPARSDVLISLYSMHRHPEFWPDPDRFLPDRFAPGRPAAQTAAALPHYLPFGAGPRTCIGMRFGLMEATIALANLAQRFRLSPAGARVPEPEASLSLHPRNGLPMFIQSRCAGE
jgi:enediyne biosynthesis protein E7